MTMDTNELRVMDREVSNGDFLKNRSVLKMPGRSDAPYFLGTVVLTHGNAGRLEVADGQQRLATTSILIAAIRDSDSVDRVCRQAQQA